MFRMVRDETFRRVPQLHEAGRSSAYRPARGNAETRSRVSKTGRRESPQAWAKTWHKKKAESSYALRRPRGFRNLDNSFRFFCSLRRQFCIGQPLAHNLRTQQAESVGIVQGIILGCPI